MSTTAVSVSKLSGLALDWAVAKCEEIQLLGVEKGQRYVYSSAFGNCYNPSSNWAVAGPIIEREDIVILRDCDDYGVDSNGFTTRERFKVWRAVQDRGGQQPTRFAEYECDVLCYEAHEGYTGPTPLIAAMRCYVASKLGTTVDVPSELV